MNRYLIAILLIIIPLVSQGQMNYMVVNIHFLAKDDGSGNFSATSDNQDGATGFANGYDYAEAFISSMNQKLLNNQPTNYTCGSTSVPDINLQLRLGAVLYQTVTSKYDKFYNSDGRPGPSSDMLFNADKEFNIFFVEHKVAGASGYAISPSNWLVVRNGWSSTTGGNLCDAHVRATLHELGHAMALPHPFGAHTSAINEDDCEDQIPSTCDICSDMDDGIEDTPTWPEFKDCIPGMDSYVSCNHWNYGDDPTYVSYNNLMHQCDQVSLTEDQVAVLQNTLQTFHAGKICSGDRTSFEVHESYARSYVEIYACVLGYMQGITVSSGQSSEYFVNQGQIVNEFHAMPGSYFHMKHVPYCPEEAIEDSRYYAFFEPANFLKSGSITTDQPITIADEEQIQVYPNPSSGIINITATGIEGEKQVAVYNLSGSMIYTDRYSEDTFQFDLSSFSDGPYFIRITSSSRTVIKKLILE